MNCPACGQPIPETQYIGCGRPGVHGFDTTTGAGCWHSPWTECLCLCHAGVMRTAGEDAPASRLRGGISVVVTFQCPRCGYGGDAASAADGGDYKPKIGDLFVCLKCGAALEFAAEATPRWLTFEEVKTLPTAARTQILAAILGVVTFRPSGVVVKPRPPAAGEDAPASRPGGAA